MINFNWRLQNIVFNLLISRFRTSHLKFWFYHVLFCHIIVYLVYHNKCYKIDYILSFAEEAENERMHLMTALQLRQPTWLFRMSVLAAQGNTLNQLESILLYNLVKRGHSSTKNL